MFRTALFAGAMVVAGVIAAPASAAVHLELKLDHYLAGGPPASERWLLYGSVARDLANGARPYELTSPSGTVSSVGDTSGIFFSGVGNYPTYDALEHEAANAGPWRLELPGATPAQTSIYDVTFDLSAFGAADVGVAPVTSPAPAAALNAGPHTFTWATPTVTPGGISLIVERLNPLPRTYLYQPSLSGNATSWTSPSLAAGDYRLEFHLWGGTTSIPVTATLIAGPDAGPFTAGMSWSQQSSSFFSVIPEPTTGALLAIAAPLIACRRRRMQTR